MGQSVLIVDDSITIRDMLGVYLQEGGYEVSTAGHGHKALELLGDVQYDFIVTDVDMPGLDGYGLIRETSKLSWRPGIVLISGRDEKSLRAAKELALALSVNLLATLSKPVDKTVLLEALSKIARTTEMDSVRTAGARLSESEFMRGLMTDGLRPVFQPRMNLRRNEVDGVEAFARWQSEDGGLMGASAIIAVANEKGYMDMLTFRMLELVIEQQGKWLALGLNLNVSVNIVAESLAKKDFAEIVSGLADQFDVPPSMITLEIGETVIENLNPHVLEVMSRLHVRGFKLALDDFGAGFGSLVKLQKIPFDELVIDHQFIGRAVEDKVAYTILESAVDLTHKLDLNSASSGLETEEVLLLAKKLGVRMGQGYHIAQPMTANLLEEWLKNYKNGSVKIAGL